jgi:serine/threonine-protein kinase Chk2
MTVLVDLIDSMLVVNPEKRFTVDQCLAHPWMTAGTPSVNDSTNGLVSGLAGLEVNRRGVVRQRTLLSAINDVQITNLVPLGENQPDIKIYSKNPKGPAAAAKQQELRPADQRDPKEFMEMGGKGDQELFGNDGESYYSKKEVAAAGPATTATKTKGTAAPAKGKGKKVNGAK